MKALFYTTVIRPGGGPGGYVYNLYAAAQHTKTDNDFSFCGTIFEERKFNDHKFWPLSLKAEIYLAARMVHIPVLPKYRQFIKKASDADVVIVHGPIHSQLLFEIRRRCSKLVFMPHSPSIWADEYLMDYAGQGRPLSRRRYELYKWTELLNFVCADYVVFPSMNAAESYRVAYRDQMLLGKDRYIQSGISLSVKSYEVGERRDCRGKTRIAFIGRYNRHKGFDLFRDVAKRMAMRSDVEFVCAGGGALSVPPHITNAGWVNDIAAFIAEVDIVVVSNRVSYFDLLPLEVAAIGKPIVFTPAGGNIDQHKALSDSILAREISVQELQSAIEIAVDKINGDRSWGLRNRQIYLQHFTAEAMLKRWDEFISAL